MGRLWEMLKDTGEGFISDDCLTRAAGIAYFTLFSIGPLLFIATGIAGIVFGRDQIDEAIAGQLTGMLGEHAAGEVRTMAEGALGEARGGWAIAIGIATLLLTAGGAFGALQTALNAIWKTEAPEGGSISETVSRLVKAKAAALGLVATTGFLLVTSLAVSAAITALSSWFEAMLPGGAVLAFILNQAVTLAVLTVLFAAIYKVLPDRKLAWLDVLVGAFATAVLFTAGKAAISLYIGHSDVAAGFDAAGTIIVVLVWLYYSAVIFLAGAEFTRAWANRNGSKQATPVAAKSSEPEPEPHSETRAVRYQPPAAEEILVAVAPLVLTAILIVATGRRSRPRPSLPRRGR